MIREILCVLMMAVLLSCSERKGEGMVLPLTDNLSATDINDFVLNDIVESVTYTQLKGGDSILYGDLFLSSINEQGDYCFFDRVIDNTISIYDKDGKMISHFNRTGRGNGEFLEINSLIFDGDDKIEVLYSEGNCVFQYDRNGTYKSKIPIENSIAIRSIGNNKYLSLMDIRQAAGVVECVRIVDEQGVVHDKLLSLDTTKLDTRCIHTMTPPVMLSGGDYYFPATTINNSIGYYRYDVKNNQLSEICEIDMGDYGVTPRYFNKGGDFGKCIMLVEPYKIGNYLFLRFFKDILYVDIWDLSTGKLVARDSYTDNRMAILRYKLPNGNMIEQEDDIEPILVHDNQLIMLCSPTKLVGDGFENIDPDGNTVVVTLKLK